MLFTKLVKELVERLAKAEAKAEELEKKVKRLEKQQENDSWNMQRTMTEHSRISNEIAGLQKDIRQLWGKSPDEKSMWNKKTGGAPKPNKGYTEEQEQSLVIALHNFVIKMTQKCGRTDGDNYAMTEIAKILLEK